MNIIKKLALRTRNDFGHTLTDEGFSHLVNALKARTERPVFGVNVKWVNRVIDWIAHRVEIARERAHVSKLIKHGRRAIEFKDQVGDDACVAIILASIKIGRNTRDQIVSSVPRYHKISYPYVARILDELTGEDPEQHYWTRGPDRKYRLLKI